MTSNSSCGRSSSRSTSGCCCRRACSPFLFLALVRRGQATNGNDDTTVRGIRQSRELEDVHSTAPRRGGWELPASDCRTGAEGRPMNRTLAQIDSLDGQSEVGQPTSLGRCTDVIMNGRWRFSQKLQLFNLLPC